MKIRKANEINKNVKACPFCGEKEEIYLEQYDHKAGARWRIFCGRCMAGIDRGYDQTLLPLLEKWNERVQ